MLDLGTAGKVALLLAVPTTSLLLYWLLRRPDDEDEDIGGRRVATSRQTCIEIRVPRKIVGAIIGRQGSVIRQIQKTTGARVQFLDRDVGGGGDMEGERVLQVRGTATGAQEAEMLIRKIIAELPQTVTENVIVPASAIGRIIGRAGETIQTIQTSSHCRISITQPTVQEVAQNVRVVTLSGTPTQIDSAKGQIEELVALDEKFRAKVEVVGATREHRPQTRKDSPTATTLLQSVQNTGEVWESTNAAEWPARRDYLDVYVSSIATPSRFWVQILNNATLDLEKFVEEMTNFYIHDPTSKNMVASAVSVGDVVAAPFAHDSCWYRARVVMVTEDSAALFYVDYGDTGTVPLSDLRSLRPNFLSPPHLAVECRLADILPTGEEWSEDAIDAFDELSHNARWTVVKVKTVRYMTTAAGMVPCVRMYDVTADKQLMDVGEELVKRGLAVAETSADNSSQDLEVALTPDPVEQP